MRATPWARALHALPTTLLLHLFVALLCTLPGSLLGVPLDRAGVNAFDLREAAEVLVQPGSLRTSLVVVAVATAAALCVAAPLLQLGWVRALSTGEDTSTCLRFGIAHYARALFQSLAIGVLCVAGLCVLAWLVWIAHRYLQEAEAQRRWTGLALSAAPAFLWLTLCAAWHDLARARLVYTEEVRGPELATALRQASHPWVFLSFVVLALVGSALGAGALALSQWRSDLAGVALAQLLLLTRSVVRSRWLAQATLLAERSAMR